MAGEVNLTVELNRPQYPVLSSEQVAYVHVTIQPTSAAPTNIGNSAPLNLSLVLDRSGSMDGDKMQKLREAAKLVINQLRPHDTISIIIFDEHVDVIAPAQPAANKAALLAQIDQIYARGGTQISVGMQKGIEQLQASQAPGQISRMVLLTDGETWEDEPRCRQIAQQASQMGISITALGLGDEWNQALLTDLASLSGGNWDYIDTPDKIMTAFQKVLAAMQGAVVTNANLTLRLVLGVHPRTVWRVTPLIDRLGHRALSDRDVQVNLGDLQQAGQSVLVELTVPARNAGTYRLAQAEVSYDVPSSGLRHQKVQSDVMLTFTQDQAASQRVNGKIMNIVEKVSAFKLMTTALDPSDAADAGTKTRRLRAAATRLLTMGEGELAQQAEAAAAQMSAGKQVGAGATKRLVAATRKLDMSDLGA